MAEGSWAKYAVIGILAIIGIVAALVLFGVVELPATTAPSTGPGDGGFQEEPGDLSWIFVLIFVVLLIGGLWKGGRAIATWLRRRRGEARRVKEEVAAKVSSKDYGRVSGTVLSSNMQKTGNPFPPDGAKVIFKNKVTGEESFAMVNKKGEYTKPLPPGSYDAFVADMNISIGPENYRIHKTSGVDVEKLDVEVLKRRETVANFTVTTDAVSAQAQAATAPVAAPLAAYSITAETTPPDLTNINAGSQVSIKYIVLKGDDPADGIKIDFTKSGPTGIALNRTNTDTNPSGEAGVQLTTSKTPGEIIVEARAKDPTGKEISPYPLAVRVATRGALILNIKITDNDRPANVIKPKDPVYEDMRLKVIVWVSDEKNNKVAQKVRIKTDDTEHSISDHDIWNIPDNGQLEIPSVTSLPDPFKPKNVKTPQLLIKAVYEGTNHPLPARRWVSDDINEAQPLAPENGVYKLSFKIEKIKAKGRPKTFEKAEEAIIPAHLQDPPLKIVIFEKFKRRGSPPHHSGRFYLSSYLRKRHISGENVMIALLTNPDPGLIGPPEKGGYRLPAGNEAKYLWITDKARRRPEYVDPDDIINEDDIEKLRDKINAFFTEKGENAVVYIETFKTVEKKGDGPVIRMLKDIVGQSAIFKGIFLINYGKQAGEITLAYEKELRELATNDKCIVEWY
ncbi:TPA: carboxypeptidase regulatory-like domain-containing protein [archaeon]|uniref:Carboxypeptidase regulatory-like domain-containing protein n=1 Tax=Candidatus Naiadarchaeum limnaeum TaxID=2756139 RepID=A0A832V263_9ARCH|nr:carboxypeptidase regulatory-like domain-containing protein [Candidatus Naiadarchaeum limnaeum]